MRTWHEGLPSELPETVALPERPGMRLRRPSAAEADVAMPSTGESGTYWQVPHSDEFTSR